MVTKRRYISGTKKNIVLVWNKASNVKSCSEILDM